MSPYTLKTNRIPRDLFPYADLPENVRDDFDYLEDDEHYSNRFFEYRGSRYDAHEFTIAPDDVKAIGFDAVEAESAFSAVVITFWDREGYDLDDQVIVGYIHW